VRNFLIVLEEMLESGWFSSFLSINSILYLAFIPVSIWDV
jgi:hypothetical protein